MSFSIGRYEGPLGDWSQAAWVPEPGDVLAPLIDRIWYFEGRLSQAVERVFPNGRLELIVQLDTPHRPPGGSERFPPLAVAGLTTTAFSVEAPPGPCRVLGLRMHPAGAFAVLGQPLEALVDATFDLTDVAGRAASELGERCFAARNGRACVAAVIAWARSRVRRDVRLAPWVAWSVARIERAEGALSLGSLRDETAILPVRFSGTFRRQVGVTPKRFARIVRFRSALARLHRTDDALAQIAADGGYTDQAHFNADFREHAGMTPSAFRGAVRYPEGPSVAEGNG